MIKSRFVAGTSNSSRSRLQGDGGGQARFAAATMPPHRHGAGIEGDRAIGRPCGLELFFGPESLEPKWLRI